VCENCWLVQTEDFADAHELFREDYVYYSSYSTSWLAHCERYVDGLVRRFDLGSGSHVVEVGSNDGYLLQFVLNRGIPCTGIEPTAGTAAAAREKGIPVVERFFGEDAGKDLFEESRTADVIIANNVLAHVPDINDFLAGFRELLAEAGVAVFEFPHLLRLVEGVQFDTIYHEHFSYLSLTAVSHALDSGGLEAFDVEEHPTHGGSLRLFVQKKAGPHPISENVGRLLEVERRAGVASRDYYAGFQGKVNRVKDTFVRFLLDERRGNRRVAAYGAAAKGNTLLNYAGVRRDLIEFVVDRNPAKQGKFMPGSRIPIAAEARLAERRPDTLIIFPWNISGEIREQLRYAKEWGCRMVAAVPELRDVS
jgi:SAM-dependent methyltransferase